jgi:phosphatidate cytidylyltransferase
VNEFAKRVVTGLIAAPSAVAALWFGGWALALFLSIAGGIATWELYRMSRVGGISPLTWIGVPVSAAIPILTHLQTQGLLGVPVSATIVIGLFVLAVAIFRRTPEQRPLAVAAITLLGIVYVGAALSFGYALRYYNYVIDSSAGTALVVLPVWLTWATDTGAYLFGRILGGPKLAPSLSPKKTISGALGGLAVSAFMCWAYLRYVLRPLAEMSMTPTGIAVFAVLISSAAIIGDLVESAIKREVGVKDASGLLPGHGGFLDRIDSLLFVLPTAYLLLPSLLIPAPIS